MNGRRRLRVRLAVLYACLVLGSGFVLLVIADLPATTFGRVQERTAGGRSGPARSTSNLPDVLAYSAIALAILVVASVAAGWLIADRALRPLRVITAAARAVSASSLDERLSLADGYEEFRELGDTLNGLFARLEAAFESQRHFVANASHELRTPLTAERTVLQVALADPAASTESLRDACRQVLRLGEQQERLVNALLTLATGQSGLRHHDPFDLADVTARIIASREPDAEQRDVRVTAELGPAVVTGDPALAESLVANLIDNAIRHNLPDGYVQISTESPDGSPDGGPRLTVSNSGPAVPPGDVDRLLEPFQQASGERTHHKGGHGLGMAIVAAVARAHGADLAVRARPEGGLDVTVTFRSSSS